VLPEVSDPEPLLPEEEPLDPPVLLAELDPPEPPSLLPSLPVPPSVSPVAPSPGPPVLAPPVLLPVPWESNEHAQSTVALHRTSRLHRITAQSYRVPGAAMSVLSGGLFGRARDH
jgi:hypothetical protein